MNRNLLLVAFSLLTWGLGESLFLYFQPLYLQQLGADSVAIGGIIGGVGVMLALTLIPTGILSDKFGSRNIMWSSWFLGVISAAIMALANSLTVFVIGYLIYGMTGFGAIAMNVYVTSSRGNLSVGRTLTFISGMYNLGAVIGPVIGGLVSDKLGFRSIYYIATAIFVISTIVILFVEKSEKLHPSEHNEPAPMQSFLKNPRFLFFLATLFVTVFALYLPQPFTPSFLQNQQQLSPSTIGILGSLGNLGNAVATLVLGNIAPLTGMIIGQLWVAAFSSIFLFGKATWLFGVGYFFVGGFRLYRAMVLAEARTMVHPSQTGLLYGIIETINSFAIILAPIVAGFLYKSEPVSMYVISLAAMLSLLFVNFIFLKKRQRSPELTKSS
jgi:DHA1 family multidrug resistance protein-like MFS transporter